MVKKQKSIKEIWKNNEISKIGKTEKLEMTLQNSTICNQQNNNPINGNLGNEYCNSSFDETNPFELNKSNKD